MQTRVLIIVLALLGTTQLHARDQPPSITWHENIKQVKQAKRPVLLYLVAPGCSYCVRMKNETFSHRDVVGTIQRKFTAVKIDGRKHADIANRLKVKLYPTTAIVHTSGAVVDVISGYHGPQEFLKRLAAAEQKLNYQTKLIAARRSTVTK